MLNVNLPIILPSYLCLSPSFEAYLGDLSAIGVSKVILLSDFDLSSQTVIAHRSENKLLKKHVEEFFRKHSIKFKIFSNILLEPRSYSQDELSWLAADNNFGLYFFTLSISTDANIAMKNIFILKNLDLSPIINPFGELAAIYSKSFCEALLTTEDLSFVFDVSVLSLSKIDGYIKTALSVNNNVFFSVSHLTSSVLEFEILTFFEQLSANQKMCLGYLSQNFINRIY